MINLKNLCERYRVVGKLKITWTLMPNDSFVVSICKLGDESSVLKSWSFEPSPITEAMSFCWYEYVEREIKTHFSISSHLSVAIPKFLQDITTNDAEDLLNMVLDQVRS